MVVQSGCRNKSSFSANPTKTSQHELVTQRYFAPPRKLFNSDDEESTAQELADSTKSHDLSSKETVRAPTSLVNSMTVDGLSINAEIMKVS